MRQRLLVGAAVLVGFFVIGGEWYLLARPMPRVESPMPLLVRTRPAQSRPSASPPTAVAKPAATITPTVGTPSTTPSLITVNTPTTVTVTVQVSPAPIANGVNLLRLGATGTQPTILGVMHDDGMNGDAVANDGIYTLQVTFNQGAVGQISVQVSAAFAGYLKRVLSSAAVISIFGVHSDNTVGLTVDYPLTLYLIPPPSGASTEFTLQSTTQFIGIGESFDNPNPGNEPAQGYIISFTSEPYNAQSFDINAWATTILPNYDITSIASTTVMGFPAFTLTFDDAQAPKLLVVVPHNGTVYEIFYNSTFDPGTSQEAAGLSDFNTVVQHLQFLR